MASINMENGEQVIISTNQGKVRGLVQNDFFGNKYYSFRGIPYAKPPINELRFQVSYYLLLNF